MCNEVHLELGGADKFKLANDGGDMDLAEEAFGELTLSGGDGPIDFQAPEEAFDLISYPVKVPAMLNLDPAV